MTTDETIKLFMAKRLTGELTERDGFKFFEMISDALAHQLYHVADVYGMDKEIARALQSICQTRH